MLELAHVWGGPPPVGDSWLELDDAILATCLDILDDDAKRTEA